VLFAGAGRRRALQQQPGVEKFDGPTPFWHQPLRSQGHLRFAGDPEQQPFVQQRPCFAPAAACRLLLLACGSPSRHLTPTRPCRASPSDLGLSATTPPAPCGTLPAGCRHGAGCCARLLAMAMAMAAGTPTPTPHSPQACPCPQGTGRQAPPRSSAPQHAAQFNILSYFDLGGCWRMGS